LEKENERLRREKADDAVTELATLEGKLDDALSLKSKYEQV